MDTTNALALRRYVCASPREVKYVSVLSTDFASSSVSLASCSKPATRFEEKPPCSQLEILTSSLFEHTSRRTDFDSCRSEHAKRRRSASRIFLQIVSVFTVITTHILALFRRHSIPSLLRHGNRTKDIHAPEPESMILPSFT